MHIKMSSLALALTFAAAQPAFARAPAVGANEAITARHYASLIAGESPKTSELTLFFTQMPKGADLHHHYSGSIYAEQYLEWIDKQGWCVDRNTYQIESKPEKLALVRMAAPETRTCMTGAEIVANDNVYRELLQRWSAKDFYNHGAVQPPPDQRFFQTFIYFGSVSNTNFNEGLLTLKKRAIDENVSYIETMFKSAPAADNADFDAKVKAAAGNDAALAEAMQGWMAALEGDAGYNQQLADYSKRIAESHAGVDDGNFTMRYQSYVFRLQSPARVFSSMLGGFKTAGQGGLVVGLNIVGQESSLISMRDYSLHMKMFKFLKARYPDVKLALHAGELALGDVPPEGLKFHIDEALNVAGANRIGHGIDLAHESNALGIMKTMREKDIPVEINLTSNAFISGIKGDDHPLTLYRKYGVPYVISTDDAGVTRHTLSNEYVLFASRYKPSYAEVKKASYNGIRYSFLPAQDKKRLTSQLDARFSRFEAEVAALAREAATKR
ncbi:adenosine deaminase [Massilia cavernae]|uniref:adenosine deaminase n=1 Tax=Massilia cavernae TaxID=2320864 RepID=A0A418XGT3_9BURK|nr:adenosine deaminase [Massilia cavernae]RJG11657.1 adenosine deaminase [Massilia cavernae]